ncbi:DUF167 domain-containing protein [Roseospira navarrensis]|uniref:UPF0235 protein GHC57_16300 n=1 Tax=Roseospira navarrensis TaxID=140058 RepID=A0A7X2D6A0_9PROT|nr:DUF167 family protein [Roseospira navarrensis]MQX38080.1 DUF167 domain-containing protein [Roseospira navarrensis]
MPLAGGLLSVRLTPKASRDRIEAIETDAEGRPWLRVSVTAVPENGKANAALVALLAKTWRLPKGAFALVSGVTARRKTLRIEAATATVEDVAARLDALPRRPG